MASNLTGRGSVLEALEGVFHESGIVDLRDARGQARKRAVAMLEMDGGEAPAAVAMLGFATDMFAAHAVELAAHLPELRRLIDRIEDVAELPPVALGRDVLRAPELLKLPTAVGIEVQLTLLLAFTKATAISLWTAWSNGELTQMAAAGELDGAAETRLAGALLQAEDAETQVGDDVAGVVIDRTGGPPVALIALGNGVSLADRMLLLVASIPVLAATLERQELPGSREPTSRPSSERRDTCVRPDLPAGPSQDARELIEDLRLSRAQASTERRLTRLRFDLHDGPQQDVLMLVEDFRLFRTQLASAMSGADTATRLLGRVDDLEARLVALDGDLRLILAMNSPYLQSESLPDALAQLTEAFVQRTGIEPLTRISGDLTQLTDSQQISLLGLIREALSNIREHSGAEHVTITLAADANGVEATVADDGRGFDPETTLVNAARAGHLGLVGMYERIRMLGGRTEIDSRPGGPTMISVTLPPGPAPAPAG